MRYHHKILICICLTALLIQGCSVQWTDAIKYGSVTKRSATDIVNIDIRNKLIIVPITIKGKEYRFLFDTGAPFSISKKLQERTNFKTLSKGNIIDSDYNKKKVNWVQVDSIKVGNVWFQNQTAFVGDFNANPIMKCLGIDGIIGSNLIRQYNWTIDQETNSLWLSNKTETDTISEGVVLPFKTDYQYNIFVDINIGTATIKNVLVDYGSNGSIALSDDIFTLLEDKNILSEPFIERGINQSGIIGTPVELNRKISYSDSVRINNMRIKNVMLRTGKTVSLGNDFLSRFKVTIDWNSKNLYLLESDKMRDKSSTAGFRLGYNLEKGIYVQSVMEKSDAYDKGIRPNMKVVKIDDLDFKNGSDFCDYVDHTFNDQIFLELINSKGVAVKYQIEKTLL
ncbi:aspartyl protease family protein [Winogradskyella aquimaris]|uniref:Aspartyl protease family protein n=1 Tax=Winogradskyella aquimaris TaxID=864074 RepID=A0ABU5EK39_9FLAO|nr:aspartyl protease family protein [Winogradskyella aquimaris]MDY2586372.1 aspartyl protease family protein [Winogradskyella aquimaris]